VNLIEGRRDMLLNEYEVPVAYSLFRLALGDYRQLENPLTVYMCLWSAFNCIYITVGDRKGIKPTFIKDNDIHRTRNIGDVKIRLVRLPREKELLENILMEFNLDLKNRLLRHPSFEYFVYRTPKWRNSPIEYDITGQRVNGVINVGKTMNVEHPVWSPISIKSYEKYSSGIYNTQVLDDLAKQVLYVLYTIRNNALHGGKRFDDSNDIEVVSYAIPLLKLVIRNFLREPRV
jgi:hypothetical protein